MPFTNTDTDLQTRCDIPTKARCQETERQFQLFISLFTTAFPYTTPTTSTEPKHEDITAQPLSTISPQTARHAALPHLTFLQTGAHLTTTHEELACVAIGNISSKLFVEVFWEAVTRGGSGGDGDGEGVRVRVLEASKREGRYRVVVGGRRFCVVYCSCWELVGSYPNITDAPSAFINTLDPHTKAALQSYHASKRDTAIFRNPDYRAAYFTIRAWALASLVLENRVLGSGALTTQQIVTEIVKICNGKETESLSFEDILRSLFSAVADGRVEVGSLPVRCVLPEYTPRAVSGWLRELDSLSLHQKLDFPRYLIISMVWFGESNLRGARWIHMLDGRVKKLITKLHAKTTTLAKVPYLIPSRLVRSSTDFNNTITPDAVHEAYYIIGLPKVEADTADQPIDEIIVQDWVRHTRAEDDISQGKSTLDVEWQSAAEMERCETEGEEGEGGGGKFVLCRREWPEMELQNPYTQDDQQQQQHLTPSEPDSEPNARKAKPKESKPKHKPNTDGEENPHPGPTRAKLPPLRPALDVLHRLQHDPRYDLDAWRVGYVDRHAVGGAVQERAAAEWVTETTHEEFVPQHRIVWFRVVGGGKEGVEGRGEVFWDKRLRRDWIFGEREEGA